MADHKSDIKLKVTVQGINNQTCADAYSAFNINITQKQLCAGKADMKDACDGDSGGPLMGFDESDRLNKAWYLAGVVSFGPEKCGTPGLTGVYSRVNQYIDWILSKIS